MPCYSPLTKYGKGITPADKQDIVVLPATSINLAKYTLRLPCGKCIGCRLERSRQWAMRCMHEMKFHSHSSFITLTFSPEHCPRDMSLDVRIFQLFMKRLRKALAPTLIRFFHCGEYGPKLGRPHYHAIIFGYDFPDRVFFKKSPSGSDLFRSPLLEELWPFGFSTVGTATFESAAYVARYIMKKVNGDAADLHYSSVDLDTGEFFQRKPEYITMSRRPGIGRAFFDQFMSDIYPSDEVIFPGRGKFKPPKYYDGLYEIHDPVDFERLKAVRKATSKKREGDSTPERLEVRRKVKEAQISRLNRNLD